MHYMCVLCTAFHRTVVTGSFENSWRISERGIPALNSWAVTLDSPFHFEKSHLSEPRSSSWFWLHWLPSKPLSLPVSALNNYNSVVCLLFGHLRYTFFFYYRHLVFFSVCFIFKFILSSFFICFLISFYLTLLMIWCRTLRRKNKGNLNYKKIC